jgi:uncharacterized protein
MTDLKKYVDSAWAAVEKIYDGRSNDLSFEFRETSFHGWPHVSFVARNARRFAEELRADVSVAEIAGLVHDLNYLISAGGEASIGADLRSRILTDIGLDIDPIAEIEDVVITAETHARGRNLSPEAMALSDADTLFKALPITPVVLAPLYMQETGKSVRELAEKIVGEQVPLRDEEIYFYSESAKSRYERWGGINLALWGCILESLDDPSVVELIEQVGKYTQIAAEASRAPKEGPVPYRQLGQRCRLSR